METKFKTAFRKNDIPFDLKLDIPNTITIAAIKEGNKLLTNLLTPRYSSIEDLKVALKV